MFRSSPSPTRATGVPPCVRPCRACAGSTGSSSRRRQEPNESAAPLRLLGESDSPPSARPPPASSSPRAGRPVDLVPAVQRADALAAAFVEREPSPQRVLIAQADIAAPTLADGLRAAGHEVTVVTAYRTVAAEPDGAAEVAVAGADAVLFASGSAVESWCSQVRYRGSARRGRDRPDDGCRRRPIRAQVVGRGGRSFSRRTRDRTRTRGRPLPVDRARTVAAPGMNTDLPELVPGPGRETK